MPESTISPTRQGLWIWLLAFCISRIWQTLWRMRQVNSGYPGVFVSLETRPKKSSKTMDSGGIWAKIIENRARICQRLWSPGIDSAILGIESWAPQKVYKYGLNPLFTLMWNRTNSYDSIAVFKYLVKSDLVTLSLDERFERLILSSDWRARMQLRRGHRLHSLAGEAIDPPTLHKFENLR